MATRVLLRTLLSSANQTLIPRYFTPASYFLRFRPAIAIAAADFRQSSLGTTDVRAFSTRPTTSSLNDSNPNWSNRPPKETILLDGCDFEHWLVVVEKPEGEPTRDEIIESYINTLAKVVGSYDEARMKIYSVSTRCYYAFGALVSEELSYKLKELPGVRWVLPDSYLDVKNKDYGGEPFIDGKAVPYDPKYHEEWIRNNARANERNRRNDRPRNFDRSRNFERRRENMQSNRGPPNMGGDTPHSNMSGSPNMGGPPPPPQGGNMGVPPNNTWNRPPPPPQGGNMGVPPNNTWNRPPPPAGGNLGGPPNNNWNHSPPPLGGNMQGPANDWNGPPPQGRNMGSPANNWNGPPPQGGDMGGPTSNWNGPLPPRNNAGPPNMGGGMHNNSPNYQQQGPNSRGMPYQSGPGPNSFQSQDVPGRDIPPAVNY